LGAAIFAKVPEARQSLWKSRFAETADKHLRLPWTATSYPFRYSGIGLNLKELGYRLPGFCISPDLIAPDGGADISNRGKC
jgi:hypothetical protein